MTQINDFQSVKAFNAAGNEAQAQVVNYAKSYGRLCRELNKAAAKNDYCDGSKVKPIADLVKARIEAVKGSKVRYAFDMCLFAKSEAGRYITGRYVKAGATYQSEAVINDINHGDVVTDRQGRVLTIGADNVVMAEAIVPATLPGLFAAFKALVKAEVAEAINARKAAEGNRRALAKQFKARLKGLIGDLNANRRPAEAVAADIVSLKAEAQEAGIDIAA